MIKNGKVLYFLGTLVVAASLCLSGCSRKTTVVLLPEDDGGAGAMTVSTDAGTVEIVRAGEATVVSSRTSRPSPPEELSSEEIESVFGEVLKNLPMKPVHFILYFEFGTTKLTADSTARLVEVLAAIERRSSESISVVGHTDTVGDTSHNRRLAKGRAEAVSRLLVDKGVHRDYIRSTSHGESNPLVETGDNVRELRNRRVEVVVR